MLHVARYPYIALLSGSGSRTKKVATSEGFALPADILQMLQPAVEQHGAQFVADQADHNERVWRAPNMLCRHSLHALSIHLPTTHLAFDALLTAEVMLSCDIRKE